MKKLILLLLFVPLISFGQTAEAYNESGKAKYDLKDYEGAIKDFTKAIEQQQSAYTSSEAKETKDNEVEQVEVVGGSIDENGNYIPDNQ